MDELSKQNCEACRIGAPLVTEKETKLLKPQIPEWEIIIDEGIQKLQRTFSFDNYTDALSFSYKVGLAAEHEDHHPRMITEWGKVTITWWTHKIKGLHRNDFIMAAKTDRLL
ncbi:4a-hydroxytetrahydrobiopterin dehydratase [Mangrovibacterium sp.]|uniref:4a-hydroxytetrahydrobiopterin dehydratase n=1 Tax=Mangrovibacterium sp. TaxID=1961364 RepID=UPI00356AEA64